MRPPITDAQRQMILDLLPIARSLRQIAIALDLDHSTVRAAAALLLAIMRATGTIGRCECGKDRFHPYICIRTKGPGGGAPADPVRTQAILSAILRGDTYAAIGAKFGMRGRSVQRYMYRLTPDQRARRKALERARRRDSAMPCASRPTRDALYRRIADCIPSWLDRALRDDVISEAYVALLDGTIGEADMREHVARFSRAARDAFASKWGTRSIDAPLAPGSDLRLADCIADPAALAAFDYIFEEAL